MKRLRWTILEVDEEAIKIAKKYAKEKQVHLGLAISQLIKEALENENN